MSLCIVIHHRSDHSQPWMNSWLDNDRIQAIQTTKEIGQLCSNAKEKNQKVLIHRCRWGHEKPTVSCVVDVESVDTIDKRTCLVRFCNPEITNREPTIIPGRGQNFYFEKNVSNNH